MKNSKSLFDHTSAVFIGVLFLLFIIWRIFLLRIPNTNEINFSLTSIFWWGGFYQIVAIIGGITGLTIAKHWGGFKSLLGRAISAISIGLLLQALGQSIATYYVYTNVAGLYPSLADIGFFGSVIMYIYGGITMVQLAGGKIALRSAGAKWIAFVVPVALLLGSYFIFLNGYEFDFTNKLRIVLDFGYPLGQAFYVSMALVALILSRKFLGGIMKVPILFLLAAFIFQYLSDYTFLNQNSHGTYIAGGVVDVMYLVSYFIMSMSLIKFGVAIEQIKGTE